MQDNVIEKELEEIPVQIGTETQENKLYKDLVVKGDFTSFVRLFPCQDLVEDYKKYLKRQISAARKE